MDHRLRVWRRTVTGLGPQRNELVEYVQVGTDPVGFNAVVNRPVTQAADAGPGVAPIGARYLYMSAAADVRVRDVLEIISGPDAGYRGEIDGGPTRPRGNHTEITTSVWHGKLPGDP